MAAAILRRAVDDYEICYMGGQVRHKSPDDEMDDIVKCFTEEEALTGGIDAHYLARRAEREALEEAARIYRMLLDRKRSAEIIIKFPKVKKDKRTVLDAIEYKIPKKLEEGITDTMSKQLAGMQMAISLLKT